MHRELDLSDDIKVKIAALKRFAEAHPFSETTMQALADRYIGGEMLPEVPERTIDIPTGWTVSYMIEIHPRGTIMRRLRVSLDIVEQVPPREAIVLLMEEFGFQEKIDACMMFEEERFAGVVALNVVEPINETMVEFTARMARFEDLEDPLTNQ